MVLRSHHVTNQGLQLWYKPASQINYTPQWYQLQAGIYPRQLFHNQHLHVYCTTAEGISRNHCGVEFMWCVVDSSLHRPCKKKCKSSPDKSNLWCTNRQSLHMYLKWCTQAQLVLFCKVNANSCTCILPSSHTTDVVQRPLYTYGFCKCTLPVSWQLSCGLLYINTWRCTCSAPVGT